MNKPMPFNPEPENPFSDQPVFERLDSNFDISDLKIPPHAIDAERAVIGGLLIDPNKYDDVIEIITEADFYSRQHKIIFRAITSLIDSNKIIDIIVVCDYLSNIERLNEVGGHQYLSEITKNLVNTRNLASWSHVIHDKSIERRLLTASYAIGDLAYDGDLTAEEKVIRSQTEIMNLESAASVEDTTTIGALKSVIETIDQRYYNPGLTGLSTGFRDIDFRTHGFKGPNLIILGGRPSMGKTAFAMKIVEHILLNEQTPTLVFSMEMSREELMERMLSSVSRIPFSLIQSGKLQEHHWPLMSSAVSKLRDVPLFIDDRPALTINQMRSAARKHKRKEKIGFIVVDFIQLGRSSNPRIVNPDQIIAEISGGLKAIAKELDLPVLALSQVNRECEKDPKNKRPYNHHLKGSGAIEQDADIIMFIYRDEVYFPETNQKDVTEIIFGKVRNGVKGTDHIKTELEYVTFDNFEGPIPQYEPETGSFNYDE